MKIGIDIDDTIADCTGYMFKVMLQEDKKKRNTGVLHKTEHIFKPFGQFDWTKEEIDDFLTQNLEDCAKYFKVIKDADKIISELIKTNEIYLITYRSLPHWKNPETITENWLKNNNIKYTKLIFSQSRDKTDEIVKNGIDLIIDDSVSSCLEMQKKGIKCILKITSNNFESDDLNKFKYKAQDWKDILKICSIIQNQIILIK